MAGSPPRPDILQIQLNPAHFFTFLQDNGLFLAGATDYNADYLGLVIGFMVVTMLAPSSCLSPVPRIESGCISRDDAVPQWCAVRLGGFFREALHGQEVVRGQFSLRAW